MLRALISYSINHFNPADQVHRGYSASVIARSLYETLQKSGYEVDYVDCHQYSSCKGKEYDIFIGVTINWNKIFKLIKTKVSILFVATTHPVNRNIKMLNAHRKWNVAKPEELMPFGEEELIPFKKADYIFQIGNEYAIKSLLKNNVDIQKIIHLHYGIQDFEKSITANIQFTELFTYLHLASGLGLRKGLAEVLSLFKTAGNNLKLKIIGGVYEGEPNHIFWKKQLTAAERNNSNISIYGFMDPGSQEYKDLIDSAAWLLFPSIEEGEPGTVLEAISRGLVPLSTREGSGIDFNISADKNLSVKEQFELSKKTSTEDWKLLSQKAIHYFKLFHDHKEWESRLMNLWEKVKQNKNLNLPKVSIILPVHNKEKTINELLKLLWKNSKSYLNWDLHIIFDGCTDHSKSVSQNILKYFNVQVYQHELENVFETQSNNYGLKKAEADYCVLLQDDNFIFESYWLEKMIAWMEQHPKVGVLGGLAGVNFFPLNTSANVSLMRKTPLEVHHRVEHNDLVFETDAVMRGPTILRKKLLEEHGYLDETYAPFYNDDMDYCFRIRGVGYAVFCYPIKVENRSLSIAKYNPEKTKFWNEVLEKNQKQFYARWESKMGKHDRYLKIPKPKWNNMGDERIGIEKLFDVAVHQFNKLLIKINIALKKYI